MSTVHMNYFTEYIYELLVIFYRKIISYPNISNSSTFHNL